MTGRKKATACVIVLCLTFELALSGCSKKPKVVESHSSNAPTTQSAPPAPTAGSYADNEKLLRQRIEGIIYVKAGLTDVDGQMLYCEGSGGMAYPAEFVVVPMAGGTPAISSLPFGLYQHQAMFFSTPPEFVKKRPGLYSLDCYNITDRGYSQNGNLVYVPFGVLSVADVQFINEYQAQGRTGLTTARSFHVTYTIDRQASAPRVSGIDDVRFSDTCILALNNAEKRWEVASCDRTQ